MTFTFEFMSKHNIKFQTHLNLWQISWYFGEERSIIADLEDLFNNYLEILSFKAELRCFNFI